MKTIYLDTETTGFGYKKADRLVSVAAIKGNEIFYVEVDPMREIPRAASKVHGITSKYLKSRYARPFSHYADSLYQFIKGHRLVIHNAPFDIGFLNKEFRLYFNDTSFDIKKQCEVVDTLKIARNLFPGQKNSLDVLAKRLGVEDKRMHHNAYDDTLILRDVANLLFSAQKKQSSVEAAEGYERPKKRRRISQKMKK